MTVILPDIHPIPEQRADDGHTLEHPWWCDPQACTTTPDVDDELLVVHRVVVLDEPRDAIPRGGRLVVDVVRGDIVCAHGGEVIAQDATAVRVRGVHEETELTPVQAGRLAAAVAQAATVGRAAELAGGAQ